VVIQHDWGLAESEAAEAAEVDRSPLPSRNAAALPEVKALRAKGYHLVPPDQPAWVFLPAIWPPSHRVWVTDRTTRYETRWTQDGRVSEHPWSPELEAELEADSNQTLAESGLSPRPRRRLWLVQLPAGKKDLSSYLRSLVRRGERAGLITRSSSAEWVEFVRDALSQDFGEEAEAS
jgi:hypothetical protein